MDTCYSASVASSSSSPPPSHAAISFTNTAKLPIDTVKKLIAAVSRRPVLWLRNNANGQKRSDITPIWFEVGQDVNLPADICRIKWGHLRDNFRKVFIRNNLSNETPSSWRFYNDMRFMERAVSDNIMRQTRSSSKKRTHAPGYWLENNNIEPGKYEPSDATVPICELSDSFDAELHRPSFSDITSFFEDSQPSLPHSKRVKLEPTSRDGDGEGDVDVESSIDDELNDDDFDEDAASENEDERSKRTQTVSTADAGSFTIELLDDDEEMAAPLPKKPKFTDPKREPEQNDLPFKYISVDASINTEATFEDDADRLFLLSLLPFLQKVGDRRKLRVRQKMQNVLVEELEFG